MTLRYTLPCYTTLRAIHNINWWHSCSWDIISSQLWRKYSSYYHPHRKEMQRCFILQVIGVWQVLHTIGTFSRFLQKRVRWTFFFFFKSWKFWAKVIWKERVWSEQHQGQYLSHYEDIKIFQTSTHIDCVTLISF